MRAIRGALLTTALAAGAAGCSSTTPDRDQDERPLLRIGGSATITAHLMPALVETHTQARNTLRFEVDQSSSGTGLEDLLDGELDIAAASRKHRPADQEQARANGTSLEADGANTVIGVDVIAVGVHPSNPLESLTYDQIIGIFCTGAIDNWSFLGHEDKPIRVLTRDPTSGTRHLFEDFFCGGKGIAARAEVVSRTAAANALEDDPYAIAYESLNRSTGKVMGLRPDPNGKAVFPSQQEVIRGAYPLYRDLNLYTAGPASGAAADFIEWVTSPAGQDVVDEQRFVPVYLRPERMDEPRPLRETIHFDVGAAEPIQRSLARLKLLASELKDRGFRHVVLEGFTDSREPNPRALSRQRAAKVQELLERELPGMYFEIIPRGARNPLAPNDTPYGRQRNRRVQVYLAEEEAEGLGGEAEVTPEEASG